VEHTQIHPTLKKDTKQFRYTSNSWRNFSELFFLLDKNPNGDMKVLVHSNFSKNLEKNEISKLHEECKIAPSPV
jgi:hypothetical protein